MRDVLIPARRASRGKFLQAGSALPLAGLDAGSRDLAHACIPGLGGYEQCVSS